MIITDSTPFVVQVERTIRTTHEAAYRAWADADEINRWFTTDAEQDVRVGGRYHNGDGDCGEYLEVSPNSRLRFTWEQKMHVPGSDVTVDVIPVDAATTTVRITHTGLSTREDAAGLDEGWSWAIDSLASYLEHGIRIPHDDWVAARSGSA